MRFIHTADWHIGKGFRFLSDETAPLLRAARLDTIPTIGSLARQHDAPHILVAGDVFDDHDLAERTLRQPLERMHAFTELTWHLIPGNHDPIRPRGVWDRIREIGPPPNVRLHLEPAAVEVGPGITLLPGPGGAPAGDPTLWMDQATTPDGHVRIGLAHGPARRFGSSTRPGAVIDPGRVGAAGLDYLALGDWHGTREEAAACWYAGTPEPDRFDQPAAGSVLVVDVAAQGAGARVSALPAATYRWVMETVEIDGLAGIEAFEGRLRARQAAGELGRILLHLEVKGSMTLAERSAFERRIVEPFTSALVHLRLDCAGLIDLPAGDDLDAIAEAGALRVAAERLQSRVTNAADPAERDRATAALLLLQREARSGA